jgi:hypothetical protein
VSQQLTTVSTRFVRQEISDLRRALAPVDQGPWRRSAQPRRPHFVFSPALVQYFAHLPGRREAVEKELAST